STTERPSDANIYLLGGRLSPHCDITGGSLKYCSSPYPLFMRQERFPILRLKHGMGTAVPARIRKYLEIDGAHLIGFERGSTLPMFWLDPFYPGRFMIYPVAPLFSQMQS